MNAAVDGASHLAVDNDTPIFNCESSSSKSSGDASTKESSYVLGSKELVDGRDIQKQELRDKHRLANRQVSCEASRQGGHDVYCAIRRGPRFILPFASPSVAGDGGTANAAILHITMHDQRCTKVFVGARTSAEWADKSRSTDYSI